ncbi:glycosyl transferase family 1 [Streptomyces griseochromogenes]|uniref:Glycosyl transferase family 1 n=1 Tax=Streptomyces griseochromogenes TaxID=68214 RepID=A0A1B1B8K0_9ACTN|nr:glycosyl transferase family 1 [Streptomyces griseochromogenes]
MPSVARGPHVLHITQPVEGGVARLVTDLAAAQLAAGLRVTVACPAGGTLTNALRAAGCSVLPWEATRAPGPRLPGEVRRLARLVRDVRPDVVHAHSAKAGLAARLAVRGRLPTVFQPHAWSFEAVDGVMAGAALRWERFGARWSSRVLCVSEAERRTGEQHGITARWQVVPNGVDTRRFRPEGDSVLRSGAGPLVVCVGRLCRQKGQDVLLQAWPAVVRQMPGARLVLVGEGPDADRLRAGAPASVEFAGPARDAAPWYRAADVVVLPSRWEGMALVPLEAMACARPVLVTDVDGARESLPPGHLPYCLVPPERPEALAWALTALLRRAPLRAALGAQGRAHVLAAHDVRHTTDAVIGVYRELLGVAVRPLVVPNQSRESITT